MSTDDQREERILDAARDLIVRFGYDKTTVREIAEGAGVSKGTIYLHFDGKKELFEGLLLREYQRVASSWLEYIEADPEGGTMGSMFRGILKAQHDSELMKAIYRQDRRILGSYLHSADNLFEAAYAGSVHEEFVAGMQRAGVIGEEFDTEVLAHVIDIIDYGFVSIGEVKDPEHSPSHEATIELMGELLDRALMPEGEVDTEAGKEVIHRLVEAYGQVLGNDG